LGPRLYAAQKSGASRAGDENASRCASFAACDRRRGDRIEHPIAAMHESENGPKRACRGHPAISAFGGKADLADIHAPAYLAADLELALQAEGAKLLVPSASYRTLYPKWIKGRSTLRCSTSTCGMRPPVSARRPHASARSVIRQSVLPEQGSLLAISV